MFKFYTIILITMHLYNHAEHSVGLTKCYIDQLIMVSHHNNAPPPRPPPLPICLRVLIGIYVYKLPIIKCEIFDLPDIYKCSKMNNCKHLKSGYSG